MARVGLLKCQMMCSHLNKNVSGETSLSGNVSIMFLFAVRTGIRIHIKQKRRNKSFHWPSK